MMSATSAVARFATPWSLTAVAGCIQYEAAVQGSVAAAPSVPARWAQPTECFVEVFPNPIRDFSSVRISAESDTQAKVGIYDLQGQLRGTVFDGALRANEPVTLRMQGINDLPAGMYFIRMSGENGAQFVRRVMVVK